MRAAGTVRVASGASDVPNVAAVRSWIVAILPLAPPPPAAGLCRRRARAPGGLHRERRLLRQDAAATRVRGDAKGKTRMRDRFSMFVLRRYRDRLVPVRSRSGGLCPCV
jgi:hypothetical protein